MASFIICQLAEQFWSVNLVTAALEFGFQVFPIETSQKLTYWENALILESISLPDVKMTHGAAQRRYKMFFCLPVFPMLRLLSQKEFQYVLKLLGRMSA
jgi:hypothetical protein